MSSLRFHRVANAIISTTQTVPQNSSFTSGNSAPANIVYDSEIRPNMLSRNFQRVAQTSSRTISSIPTPTTPKPTVEEFDPLNPGEWQLGARGKIVPRLPEGTRCGKLVMGKYGLYSPELRKKVLAFQAGLDAGKKSENARPFDANLSRILYILAAMCGCITIYNFSCLIKGRLLFPFHEHKTPGSS